MTVWTIGHSTRSTEEFLAALAAHEIEAVVDVRRFPGSRRLPQFGTAALEASLRAGGVSYAWIDALGGRRRADAESPNDAWNNDAFRGYADHTGTEEFAHGLVELLMVVSGLRTAIMCAELLWWRCHRRIIADYLIAAGEAVFHILSGDRTEPAHLTPGVVRGDDGTLLYPKADVRGQISEIG